MQNHRSKAKYEEQSYTHTRSVTQKTHIEELRFLLAISFKIVNIRFYQVKVSQMNPYKQTHTYPILLMTEILSRWQENFSKFEMF